MESLVFIIDYIKDVILLFLIQDENSKDVFWVGWVVFKIECYYK